MKDKQFENLKKKIEVKMIQLKKLQEKIHVETGQDHVMPCYLSTPKHLEGIK